MTSTSGFLSSLPLYQDRPDQGTPWAEDRVEPWDSAQSRNCSQASGFPALVEGGVGVYMHTLGQGEGGCTQTPPPYPLPRVGEGGTTETRHPEAHLLQFHDSLGLFSCLTSIDWEIIRRSIFLSRSLFFFFQVRQPHCSSGLTTSMGTVGWLPQSARCLQRLSGMEVRLKASSPGLGREWQRGP